MPQMDGLQATKIIRKNLNMQDLPIIAMTAHAMKGDRDKCFDAGMNGYIAKPIDCKAIICRIEAKYPRSEANSIKTNQKPNALM